MILVDASVWIDYFRNAQTPQVALLDACFGRVPLAVGDLVAAEVLQGVRDARESKRVRQIFDAFVHVDLVGYTLALKAAENHRYLRDRGVTIRKTIDTLIATYCIEHALELLHNDRDFEPFEKHLGLRVLAALS